MLLTFVQGLALPPEWVCLDRHLLFEYALKDDDHRQNHQNDRQQAKQHLFAQLLARRRQRGALPGPVRRLVLGGWKWLRLIGQVDATDGIAGRWSIVCVAGGELSRVVIPVHIAHQSWYGVS